MSRVKIIVKTKWNYVKLTYIFFRKTVDVLLVSGIWGSCMNSYLQSAQSSELLHIVGFRYDTDYCIIKLTSVQNRGNANATL